MIEEAGLPEPLDMAVRAAAAYILALALVRLGKNRLLRRATPFDMILAFILGSLFSRAINGTASLWPSAVAGATLVFLHWLFSTASRRWHGFGALAEGRAVELIRDGRVLSSNLRKAELSARDLEESLRLRGSVDDVREVLKACLERNGEISVLKVKETRVLEVKVEEGAETVRIELVG